MPDGNHPIKSKTQRKARPNPTSSNYRFGDFLLLLSLYLFSAPTQFQVWADSDHLEYILLNQRSFFTTCGDFKYSRRRRNCEDQIDLDFKRCIQAEQNRPLYEKSSHSTYHCFNTNTQQGKTIIKELLTEKNSVNQCFEKNIYELHEGLITHPKFSEYLTSFKKKLGFNIKIHYAFDSNNRRSTIQLLLRPSEEEEGGGRGIASHRHSVHNGDAAVTLLSNSNASSKNQNCHALDTEQILHQIATVFHLKLTSQKTR